MGCRYQMSIGKYTGYYCGRTNVQNTEMCNFHNSVVKWDKMWNKKKPSPIWAKAVYPDDKDSKLSIIEFPWASYDINDILLSIIDQDDIVKWNQSQHYHISDRPQFIIVTI